MHDEELVPLFLVASKDRVNNNQRFEENLRRLLTRFAVNLKSEAQGRAQKAVVHLLRSRSAYIAGSCSRHLGFGQSGAIFDQLKAQSNNNAETRIRLELLLRDNSIADKAKPPGFDYGSEDEDQSISDDDNELKTEDLPELSRIQQFLLSSVAFNDFRTHIREFIQPSLKTKLRRLVANMSQSTLHNPISEPCRLHLESLISELDVLRAEELTISTHDNLSISNLIKSGIEDFTMKKWDWWPLRPRLKCLSGGCVRIRWYCVSNPWPLAI